MSNSCPSQQPCWSRFSLTQAVVPLTLGVALLTSIEMPANAIPVIINSPRPTTQIYGSPIPSPVPVVPGTSQPSLYSPYNNTYGNIYRPYDNTYRRYDRIRTSGRGTIRNSTLINPTIIDSTITDSVLVDPTIINSSGYPRRGIRNSGIIYRSPGVRINIGY